MFLAIQHSHWRCDVAAAFAEESPFDRRHERSNVFALISVNF